VNPALGADDPYYYRNKMEFSFGERWLTRDEVQQRLTVPGTRAENFALGLHIPLRFDKVLDVEECWLQSAVSQRIVNTVRQLCRERALTTYSTRDHTGYLRNLVIRQSTRTGELMANFVTSEDRPDVMRALSDSLLTQIPEITTVINNITQRKSLVAIGDRERITYGPGYISERIGNKIFRISANSFFQTNTAQAERLYMTVRRLAHLKPDDVVYDLYSGTGTIALLLADDAAVVVGIESVESAVEDARRNAEMNGVHNCTFICGDLKEKLTHDKTWMANHSYPSVLILDPPRAGVHPKVLDQIQGLRPNRVVYVSCNPATQARDVAILCSRGTYAVREAQPVDMFPQTGHIENVVVVDRS
jgi:23S rRNA (uracil1939-C5)-methyltransferase